MKLFVALAIFEGCPRRWLDDGNALRAALEAAIEAGPFTPYQTVVQPFQPQGVTACAVVGESHLALHSWPEEGRLFVDVASCSTLESVRRAIEAIGRAMPEGRLAVLDERVIDHGRAAPP
jgi:S-adenosylmethionine decarboxylase